MDQVDHNLRENRSPLLGVGVVCPELVVHPSDLFCKVPVFFFVMVDAAIKRRCAGNPLPDGLLRSKMIGGIVPEPEEQVVRVGCPRETCCEGTRDLVNKVDETTVLEIDPRKSGFEVFGPEKDLGKG